MNDRVENRPISVAVYPGQKTPGMPPHWAAAAMKKIGRLLRAASASAVSQVVNQATPASPTGSGLAPSSSGLGPPCASAPVARTTSAAGMASPR